MHIIGTAGHVDHGKSALVRALTGTDPDRWIEEQRRGMTLDLGFAHLRYEDGVEAGIIDVPGHERFLHNMLAGAAGMELVLLVVAADEGPKPQTFEHLAILQYLQVRRTLVVLSKSDTVSVDELAFRGEIVREALTGTLANGAPIYPVSTVTDDGLAELRAAIHAALVTLPARVSHAPAYLPIDRVFALAGHGTIVTGTLWQGRITVGDVLKLSPLERTVRVRSLQVFGMSRDCAEGGTRVAVNLPGIDTTEIARGAVLASPQFSASASFDVHLRPLPSALGLLKRRTPVRAHIGSAEILGTLVLDEIRDSVEECSARLHLRAPTLSFPGVPFVLRRLSPKQLLGGGTIAGNSAAAACGEPDDKERSAVLAALRELGLGGATPSEVGARANLREERAGELLLELVENARVLRLTKPPAFVDAELANELCASAAMHMRQRQRKTPWALGARLGALSQALGIAEPTLARVLAVFVEDGVLAYRCGNYATPDFSPQLSAAQRTFFTHIFADDPDQPFMPIAFAELAALMKSADIPGISQAFDTLLACGTLVRVGDAVYRGSQIGAIRARLETALKSGGRLTVSEFRDLIGTSRKYALPLLEFFDASGVSVRSGDVRVLRRTTKDPIIRAMHGR